MDISVTIKVMEMKFSMSPLNDLLEVLVFILCQKTGNFLHIFSMLISTFDKIKL